ncbi:MAG: hypothetical protein A2651_02955 [Candidatus Yanofskybacteria bacterium RIFCSPHIGHO2_01_FULL_42_12]|nr:MAG: hypothetical protein A2651_02955 [Candidatus Yanofskybacteria bacterium RIFCSPHIGHO2_01_FULL_42_12]
MSTVVKGKLFKNTTVKCDDPFNLGCDYSYNLCFNEAKTLATLINGYGWHKDESGRLACPNCWGRNHGNYKETGAMEDVQYDLFFQNGLLRKIDIGNPILLEKVNKIIDKEVCPEDRQSIKLVSYSWASHWYYGGGTHGSSISIVIDRSN